MVMEFQCNNKAINFFLRKLPMKDAFHIIDDTTIRKCELLIKSIVEGWRRMNPEECGNGDSRNGDWFEKTKNFNSYLKEIVTLSVSHKEITNESNHEESFVEHFPETFPCYLVVLGSACSMIKVNSK